MLSSVALLLVVQDTNDEDDTSLTYAYVCLVVCVQGWGKGIVYTIPLVGAGQAGKSQKTRA